MENSNIKADYVFYCDEIDEDIDTSKITNISELSKYDNAAAKGAMAKVGE